MEKIKNAALQAEEMEALAAIYEEHFTVDAENAFTIKIRNNYNNEVILRVTLTESYPLESPPLYDISAPWMTRQSKLKLIKDIQEVYRRHAGECVIHLWIVTIQDFIDNQNIVEEESNEFSDTDATVNVKDLEICSLPDILHGEPIIDKKSVFQAHLARITSEKQIPLVLGKLKENRKVASATHNTYAYRILDPHGSVIEGSEDDGEKKAGLVLLHLLQVSNLSDTLIIVTRWYGGIHLGADRFRHYNNAARSLINQLELTKNHVPS